MKKFISVGLFGMVMLISGLVIGKTVVGSSWGGTKIGAHSEHITLDHVGDSYQLPGENWRLLDDVPSFSINQDGVITASGEGSARIVYEVEGKTVYSSVKVDEFPDWGEYKQIESNVSILGQFDHPYDVEQMKFTAISDEYLLNLILLSNAGGNGSFRLSSDEEELLSIDFSEMEKAGDSVYFERELHLEEGKTYYISLNNDLYFDLLTSYSIDLTPIN
ncbi:MULTISPECIES: hypothetical protein [unclassified Enterococcus]|uniref:hypothetical protein n=1 Tax=unclassified Enterococcus TaxID=2608891 RepID=UPI001CE212D0|nr:MULTISPECIES: hypothetical protein [unclassified Enterococcus]MCA5013512.1 hypothetical protein [Enterococcus sp. S23]MCA5016762.1 hypothetical protein [Enterococcus sp. S22(2020)]